MITSTKMYTKKEKQNKTKWTDRTLGQVVKAKLYRQNHKRSIYITVTKREKGKYIYIK